MSMWPNGHSRLQASLKTMALALLAWLGSNKKPLLEEGLSAETLPEKSSLYGDGKVGCRIEVGESVFEDDGIRTSCKGRDAKSGGCCNSGVKKIGSTATQ